jgi:hypothetical protein
MKMLLGIVALLNLAVGLYLIFTGDIALGCAALGSALFASTARAIVERLDTIAKHLVKTSTSSAVSAQTHAAINFDTAKAVEAMREVQRLGRS